MLIMNCKVILFNKRFDHIIMMSMWILPRALAVMGCDVGPYFSLAIYNTLNEVRYICAAWILGEKSTDQWVFINLASRMQLKVLASSCLSRIIGAPMGISWDRLCLIMILISLRAIVYGQ